jgi:hypothetical protein
MTERQRGMVLQVLLSRMRHQGCGGRPGQPASKVSAAGRCIVLFEGSR